MSSKQPISTFLGIAAAVVLVSSSYAAIINVPGGQPTIQAGINAAANGDEVVVAIGTYNETINFGGKAITVRSTDPNDAGIVMATIIDGTGFFHVVQCVNGEGPDTVLSGFVITGGNANGAFPDDLGGGMNNLGSNPTVTNCTFIGNTATFGGGGMRNNSSPTVTNCTFSGNTAEFGGGMYFSPNSNPTVTNCTFSGNTAVSGGGMYNLSSSPTVTNCLFSGNTATQDAGGMFNSGSSPTVTNCTFIGNTAGSFAGGMLNRIGSNPTVTNCTFSGNSALGGGGMFNTGTANPTLTNTGFCGNTPDPIFGPFTDGGGNSLLYCPPPIPKANPCPTDTNDDGVTNVLDLIDVLLAFGQACP